MPFSVKGLLNDSQISLEKAATDSFGAVVEDFTRSTFSGAGGAAGSQQQVNRNDGSWYSTSYAATLSGGSNYRPKLKFLFKVQFVFTEAAKQAYPAVFGSKSANDFTFMIKSVDRPKVDFEYEEDVNMYNFRTKVLKRIRHRDLTLTFMDDTGNRVFDFFRTLMMVHSPITRGQTLRDGTLAYSSESLKLTRSSGMSFAGQLGDSANRAVVNSTFGNSIEAIRVQQIFVDPSGSLETATKMVSFDFINPRIVSFDLDELSHEANDVNLLTMIFDYDWMEMVKVGSLGTAGAPYGDDQRQLVFPKGLNGAPSDITPNRSSGVGSPLQGGNKGSSGFIGSVTNSVSAVLGRSTSQLTSDIIGKAVQNVAGNNRFGTALGGIVSASVSGPIGGIVAGATRDRLGGLTSNLTSTDARATSRILSDSSTAGSDRALLIVPSSDALSSENPAIDNRPGGGI